MEPHCLIPHDPTWAVDTIYHLSDIHIHLYKRHAEYAEVFDRVIAYLRAEKSARGITTNRNIPLLCVLTGDILHSKSDLSPECVAMTYKLFKDLSEIMPTLIIPGNHDLNMNNKLRLDSLTPIICDLPAFNPVYYLNESGLWHYNNLCFGHASIFDYKIPAPTPGMTSIALFHGRVNGVILFNGVGAQGEEYTDADTGTKKVITLNDFKAYDMALFGDIHRHQWLDPTRAYAGSLIQQNHGETLTGHGLIKWSVPEHTGQFVPIPNDYGYVTFHMTNGHTDIPQDLPKHLKVRILYSGTTTQVQIDSFLAGLKANHTLVECSIQADETRLRASTEESTNQQTTLASQGEVNINDVAYQNTLIETIINEQYEDFPEDQLEIIKSLNAEANTLLETTERPRTGSTRYKLIRLEFDNLFSYGANNVIHFEEFKGIVGIIAPNHMGKSAIIDIILWTLFDKFPRKGSTNDIINNRLNDYRSKLELEIGNWRYTIEKSGRRASTKNKCTFIRRNILTGKIENLDRDNSRTTKQVISETFGAYEDMINTNFSIQTNSTGFIDAENTSRRKELERILRFDFLTDLAKKANEGYTEKKTIFEHLQKNMPPELITKMMETIASGETRLEQLEQTRNQTMTRAEELQAKINELNRLFNPDIDKQLEATIQELGMDAGQTVETHLAQLDRERLAIAKEIEAHTRELEGKGKTLFGPEYNLNLTEVRGACSQKKQEHAQARAAIKTELDQVTQAIHLQLSGKRGYITASHANRNATWFDARIAEIEAQLATIDKDLDTQIQTLEEKNAGHRTKIEEKRQENERLMSESLVPQFMRDLLNNNALVKATEQVATLEPNGLTPDYIKAMKELGFLERLNDMVKNNLKSQETIQKNRTRITECQARIAKYEAEIRAKREQLKRAPNPDTLLAQINTLTNDKGVLEHNAKLDTEVATQVQQKKKLEAAYTDMTVLDQCDEMLTLLARYEAADAKRKDNRNRIKAVKVGGTELEDLMKKVEVNMAYQTEMIDVMTDYKKTNDSLARMNGELQVIREQNAGYRAQLEKMKADCLTKIEVEKMMNIYKVYRDTMKQIPFRLIQQVKGILERKVNDLLAMCTNFSVKFEIGDTKIDIYLNRDIYAGRPILINNSSGFERFISSLAIRIALMEISQLPSPNFMAIDEGWSCFDNENINNVDVILDHLVSKFDYILTISHLQVIRQHCDIQIGLRRDDSGFSSVNYG